jgi:hypothetical protein
MTISSIAIKDEWFQIAWDMQWAATVKSRGKDYRGSHGHYLTASDIENQVRLIGIEVLEGKPAGTGALAFGRERTYGVKDGKSFRVRFSGNLQGVTRRWLFDQVRAGKLADHNFGRGHISGARFRPAGEDISETEKKTIKAKEARKDRPRVRHYREGSYGSRPLCVIKAREAKGRRMWGFRPSQAWSTNNKADVTCVRCLNLLKAEKAA